MSLDPQPSRRPPSEHAQRVDRVVAAVTAVEGVAGLATGGAGSIGTYLPGRTVPGIRLGDDFGQVNIVAELDSGTKLIDIADRARQAASEAAGVPITVYIADVRTPDETETTPEK